MREERFTKPRMLEDKARRILGRTRLSVLYVAARRRQAQYGRWGQSGAAPRTTGCGV